MKPLNLPVNIKSMLLLFRGNTKSTKKSISQIIAFNPMQHYIVIPLSREKKNLHAILLMPHGIAHLLTVGERVLVKWEHSIHEGHIKIYDPSNEKIDFTIPCNTPTLLNKQSFKNEALLQKIPEADAFSGKIYKGTLTQEVNGSSLPFKIRFQNGQAGYCVDSGCTALNHNYTLHNNGVAACAINADAFGVHSTDRFLFVFAEKRLLVSWVSVINNECPERYSGELVQVKN